MKQFAAVASFGAVLVDAASTRAFTKGAGANGTSGQWVRLSAPTTVDILNTNADATAPVKWTVTAWGVYYEDSGEQKIRLQHNLYANIFATDVVLFELAFRPKTLGKPTDTVSIGEDYVQCEMSRSSTDGAFWSASVAEGYYICNPTSVASEGVDHKDNDTCWNQSGNDANYS